MGYDRERDSGHRTDPSPPLVLYDGECGLCTGAVEFIRRRSRPGAFRFAPLESDEAEAILAGRPSLSDTLILLDAAGIHERSTAALRIAAGLRRPWSWLRLLRIVPVTLRDRGYDFIARRRLNWFGRPHRTCGPGSRCPYPGKR